MTTTEWDRTPEQVLKRASVYYTSLRFWKFPLITLAACTGLDVPYWWTWFLVLGIIYLGLNYGPDAS